MRVLHLSTFDVRGGAARGAYWLHRELLNQGVDSKMLVGRKYGDDVDVFECGGPAGRLANKLRIRLDPLPLRRYRRTDESFWTLAWMPSRIDRAVETFAPDLVHIHWVGGGFLPIEALKHLRTPLIWTLRDMWVFTGGCHYTAGCERYMQGCGYCPQLRSSSESDVSRQTWLRKEAEWRGLDLWLVPISSWLADCARETELFRDTPIEVIPNGVDIDRFPVTDKAEAKASWQFAPERRHILFGAVDALRDSRKGFSQFVEAARHLAQDDRTGRAEIVVFGDMAPASMPELGLPVRFVGNIDDDDALARLYAAADVMVAPSLQEAFGKTLIEAMACGTPVVAFGSGGPTDIVDHRRTGYLAEPFDPRDLARGIAWCLDEADQDSELGLRARMRVERDFGIGTVAEHYRALYRRILARIP
jgi:glycosyltransferase involved in cell wall biosynthesis